MLNVTTETKGKKLIITVDTSEEHGLSKSGKTKIIASTRGNVDVGDGVFVGLNVYRYADPK